MILDNNTKFVETVDKFPIFSYESPESPKGETSQNLIQKQSSDPYSQEEEHCTIYFTFGTRNGITLNMKHLN